MGRGQKKKQEVLVRSALFCQKMAVLPVLAYKAENPVFKSVEEALCSLLESSEDVSMTGSVTGHIPDHIVDWGLV